EVQLGPWLVKEGQPVERDKTILEIETDKATVEMPAPVSGMITKVLKKEGDKAAVGEVIAYMEESSAGAASAPAAAASGASTGAAAGSSATAVAAPPATAARTSTATHVMPAAARELAQRGLTVDQVAATGPGGRLLKEDVLRSGDGQKAATTA